LSEGGPRKVSVRRLARSARGPCPPLRRSSVKTPLVGMAIGRDGQRPPEGRARWVQAGFGSVHPTAPQLKPGGFRQPRAEAVPRSAPEAPR
ncbi:hypothetical protein PTTG_09427, partial [Puccinia triticina 1-1 BBBD Race 1]|uniref:Uncharacterized protein n=1 Tax=Puccinia triticina (isolate 1-1 / race 1 (BBBD)) TaxID=630390 RepID=A0A0C4F8D3_PUCT1